MTMSNPAKDIEAFGGFFHPVERPLPGGGTYSSGGITLRDWFAAQAMAAIIAKLPLFGLQSDAGDISIGLDTVGRDSVMSEVAGGAFDYADAMLAQRSKP